MLRITEVVKQLLILNIAMFVGISVIVPDLAPATYLWYPGTSEYFQPYQLVSHMFMHADQNHLIFNMISLFFLGPTIEDTMGPKKFLIYYFICGFGATALHLFMIFIGFIQPVAVVGASGAIMGIFIAYLLFYPNNTLRLIFPPIPVKAKYMILFFIGMDLLGGFGGLDTGIAHFAHLGGALLGFLTIVYWNKGIPGVR